MTLTERWLEACGKSCLHALQEACIKHCFKPSQGLTFLIYLNLRWVCGGGSDTINSLKISQKLESNIRCLSVT